MYFKIFVRFLIFSLAVIYDGFIKNESTHFADKARKEILALYSKKLFSVRFARL